MGYFLLFSIFSKENKKLENGMAIEEAAIFFMKILRSFFIPHLL
jgi:hypothetical protein